MLEHIITLVYLAASVLFIIGLKKLSHPDSARRGNQLAAVGMALAVLATLVAPGTHNHVWIIAAIAVGTVIGTVSAKKVKMTSMPEMVSFFNGMGGACAAVISVVEFMAYTNVFPESTETTYYVSSVSPFNGHVLVILLGLIIGSISFSGSMIAMGKLQGFVTEKAVRWPMQRATNAILLLGLIVLAVLIMTPGTSPSLLFHILLVLSLLYGVLFVLPIGGADMPVVVSLLNSFTGVAAACGGFLYDNSVMLTGGILVGSAGTILTILMCRAMNRSLANVLLGNFSGGSGGAASGPGDTTVREIGPTDAAILMSYAKKVVIVPGYGLAVAQAQHICRELDELLEEKGVIVKYGIHPVAGRMPGHMNVLLAEADVPYPKLLEMDEINPEFPATDVVLVIGANDVVNPAARTDTSSPIYGMPILDVDRAQNIIILKRSMRAGYAGIENELFYHPKTRMLFGDAKDSLERLMAEVKSM